MKKYILTIAVLLSLAVSSFGAADGVIKFGSLASDSISGGHSIAVPIFDVNGTTLLAGTGFSVQLFYGSVGAADSALIALGSPASFFSGGLSGYFDGGNVAIPGFASGTQAQLQVRAWNNAGGTLTSFDSALVRGSSASFVSQALGVASDPSTYPVMTGLTSFQLAAVPEPTTIALGVLGGLGLLARRRRNA
jgi:hypothetical protein